MPNYCDYDMRVKGNKKDIDTLVKWLNAGYNYEDDNKGLKCWTLKDGVKRWEAKEEDKIKCDHHIGYRVFSCEKDYGNNEDGYESYYGECAWSVASCMFDGVLSYMNSNKDKKDERYAISIVEASKELGLDIEIFSSEIGCQFSEHYCISEGELISNETADYCFNFGNGKENCDFINDDGHWDWKLIH